VARERAGRGGLTHPLTDRGGLNRRRGGRGRSGRGRRGRAGGRLHHHRRRGRGRTQGRRTGALPRFRGRCRANGGRLRRGGAGSRLGGRRRGRRWRRLRGRGRPFRRARLQLLDPIDHRGIEARQSAGLDVEVPLLDQVKQFRALQAQFFRQLVDTGGQLQLLLGGAPAFRPVWPDRSVLCPVPTGRTKPSLPPTPGVSHPSRGGQDRGEHGAGGAWQTRSGRRGGRPMRRLMVFAFPILFPRTLGPR
jgi:hypothetical protein